MVTYEVTLDVVPEHAGRLDAYMLDKHIGEVVATGCFNAATYFRDGHRRKTVYEAPDQVSLNRYLDEFAAKLRDDFVEHFPSGVTPSRDVWTAICRFEAP
ncbi:MAG: DUF4286 family protein [Blastocatellia bacterium]|nr:DUF4286 family protein [Blastocatellia bacterium]